MAKPAYSGHFFLLFISPGDSMRRDMDLESWEVFCAVAGAGSITGACETLGMDASGVSRIIKSLEKALGGVALFDRSIRPFRLTENGERAYGTARRMLEEHRQLLEGLETDPEAMRGTIRLGLPPLVLQNFLLPFLIEFNKDFPEIDLSVSEYTGSPPVSFDAPRGRLDVICGYGADASHPNYVQICYGVGAMIPCASPLYLSKYGIPTDPEELREHTGVVFSSSMRPAIRSLQKNGVVATIRWKNTIRFDSAASAHNATLLGAGIEPGIPALHCFRSLQLKQLIPVLPGWRPASTKLFIYALPETMRLKRVRTLIERYRDYMHGIHRECERVLKPIVGPIELCVD